MAWALNTDEITKGISQAWVSFFLSKKSSSSISTLDFSTSRVSFYNTVIGAYVHKTESCNNSKKLRPSRPRPHDTRILAGILHQARLVWLGVIGAREWEFRDMRLKFPCLCRGRGEFTLYGEREFRGPIPTMKTNDLNHSSWIMTWFPMSKPTNQTKDMNSLSNSLS